MITVLVHDSTTGRTKYVAVSNLSDLDSMFGHVIEAVDETGESYVTGSVSEHTPPVEIAREHADLDRSPRAPGAP